MRPSEAAHRRTSKNKAGAIIFPRIIERRPRRGDMHPLNGRAVRAILRQIPLEYLYGLSRIELRARTSDVGVPFGQYRRDEKAIILYSLPSLWIFPSLNPTMRHSLSRFYAKIEPTPEGLVCVTWPKDCLMSLWFYCEVMAHELGHHYRWQYRHRNGRKGSRVDEEIVADLHAKRLTDQILQKGRTCKAM